MSRLSVQTPPEDSKKFKQWPLWVWLVIGIVLALLMSGLVPWWGGAAFVVILPWLGPRIVKYVRQTW